MYTFKYGLNILLNYRTNHVNYVYLFYQWHKNKAFMYWVNLIGGTMKKCTN